MENAIYHPPTYFDNRYEDEWITNELSIRIIKAVDKSEVISSHLIQSPVMRLYVEMIVQNGFFL